MQSCTMNCHAHRRAYYGMVLPKKRCYHAILSLTCLRIISNALGSLKDTVKYCYDRDIFLQALGNFSH
jgi:hypothetical protein